MTNIVPPTQSQLDAWSSPIWYGSNPGWASPLAMRARISTPPGNLYFRGSLQNQFGARLGLDVDSLFEIASVTKTFTATL